MILDGFTIIAQVLNFLILLVLMRRFLYQPILNAMAEREQNITLRQREAERRREEAEREAQDYRQLRDDLEQKREGMLGQAHTEAEELRKQMVHEARREVEHAKTSWYKAIQEEKESLLHHLNQQASRQTLEIARRALEDLANVELEEQILNIFIQRLRALDRKERAEISRALLSPADGLMVRTTFPLSPDQQQQVIQAVGESLDGDHLLNFETEESLLCGIELKAPGHKISWSLSSYLETLQDGLFQVLREDLVAADQAAIM